MQKHAVDDDVPPPKPVEDQQELEFDIRKEDNYKTREAEEEAIVVESSSQVKGKKPLLVVSSKRSTFGVNNNYNQYPVSSMKLPVHQEVENLHVSSARDNNLCRNNKASIPTILPPPPSVAPKLHLSSSPDDEILRMDQHPTPRLRVPANCII